MSIEKLGDIRSQLEANYLEWFEVIDKRRLLIQKVVNIKNESSIATTFDLERESYLFTSLKPYIETLSIGELLSLSLMVEFQVISSGGRDYPRWSERNHLTEKIINKDGNLILLCNPILVAIWKKDVFQREVLPFLSQSWKNKLQHLSN